MLAPSPPPTVASEAVNQASVTSLARLRRPDGHARRVVRGRARNSSGGAVPPRPLSSIEDARASCADSGCTRLPCHAGLSDGVGVAGYYAASEMLTNTVEHAQASARSVRLSSRVPELFSGGRIDDAVGTASDDVGRGDEGDGPVQFLGEHDRSPSRGATAVARLRG